MNQNGLRAGIKHVRTRFRMLTKTFVSTGRVLRATLHAVGLPRVPPIAWSLPTIYLAEVAGVTRLCRRSHPLATAARGGSGAQAQSGSGSRKRSREAREMTNDADDAHSDDERAKRTRTNSERQRDAAQGGRKQPKVRRGRK